MAKRRAANPFSGATRARRAARRVRTAIQASRSVSPEEKAAFHQVSGAGRSRVLRPFLGLTEPEEDEIGQKLAPLIDDVLRRKA